MDEVLLPSFKGETPVVSSNFCVKEEEAQKRSLPLREVLRCPNLALHSLMVQHFTACMFSYTLLTELPSFLGDRYAIAMEDVALSLIPVYVCYAIGQQAGGALVDYALNVYGSRLSTARLCVAWVSFAGSGALLVAVGFFSHAPLRGAILGLGLATCALGLSVGGGWAPNFVDLFPSRASDFYAASNFIANFAGILAPLLTSSLVQDNSPTTWLRPFAVVAIFNLFAVSLWSFTISTEPLLSSPASLLKVAESRGKNNNRTYNNGSFLVLSQEE